MGQADETVRRPKTDCHFLLHSSNGDILDGTGIYANFFGHILKPLFKMTVLDKFSTVLSQQCEICDQIRMNRLQKSIIFPFRLVNESLQTDKTDNIRRSLVNKLNSQCSN